MSDALADIDVPSDMAAWRVRNRLEIQLRDYVSVSMKLFWQRQGIFLGATIMAAYYFSYEASIACYLAILITELIDLGFSRRIIAWQGNSPRQARRFLVAIIVNTILSGMAISAYVIIVARIEGPTMHFVPLFFMFSAALFAAMNNHQLIQVLILRIGIYGCTFLYIAIYDIWLIRPPLKSELWLQLFTVIFVLYFLTECALVFLRFYRNSLDQIEALRDRQERTLAAYRTKSEFLSVVSHELRTPLTSIKGSLNLISGGAMGEVPAQMRQVLEVANKNSNRLALLIDDLLDFQALENGKMAFELASVDLSRLIRDAIDAAESYRKDRGVTFRVDCPRDPVVIECDAHRMMQVLANILSNAVKFSAQGGVVDVTLNWVPQGASISIRDRGKGIPANARSQVFGAFTQVDSSDNRVYGGTGLGMNITKKIVELHAGSIDYESAPGEGTTFTVILPGSPPQAQARRPAPMAAGNPLPAG